MIECFFVSFVQSLVQLRLKSEFSSVGSGIQFSIELACKNLHEVVKLHQILVFADSYLNKMEWSAYAGDLKL